MAGATKRTAPAQSRDAAATGLRARKKIATKRRILEAAARLMGAQGYDAVRVEEICDAADVSVGTFFKYFPVKAALQKGFVEILAAEIAGRIDAEADDPVGKLEFIRTMMYRQWGREASFGPRLFAAFVLETSVDFDIEHPQTGLSGLVGKILREGQRSGDFHKRFDPDIVAVSLIASWIALARVLISRDEAAKIQKLSSQVLETFLGGVRVR